MAPREMDGDGGLLELMLLAMSINSLCSDGIAGSERWLGSDACLEFFRCSSFPTYRRLFASPCLSLGS